MPLQTLNVSHVKDIDIKLLELALSWRRRDGSIRLIVYKEIDELLDMRLKALTSV